LHRKQATQIVGGENGQGAPNRRRRHNKNDGTALLRRAVLKELGLVDGRAVAGAHKGNLAVRIEGEVVFAHLEALVDLDTAPHTKHVALLARGRAVVDSVLAARGAGVARLALAGGGDALGVLHSVAVLRAVGQGLRSLASNTLGISAVAPVAAIRSLGVVGACLGAGLQGHVALARNARLSGVVAHKVQSASTSSAALVNASRLALGGVALVALSSQRVADTVLVVGAVIRAFASRLGAVGICEAVAVLALVGGVVAPLVLKRARLLTFVFGLLTVWSLCTRLALLGLLVASSKLGGLASLLALALRRVCAIIAGDADGLSSSVVARVTRALLSAKVEGAVEGQRGLTGNEASAMQTRVASVIVDNRATHAPTALKLAGTLANAGCASHEAVARIGVVLSLGHTAAHNHNRLVGSRRAAEQRAGALEPAGGRGKRKVHASGGCERAGEGNRGEVAGSSLPGVASRQHVHACVAHSVKSISDRVGDWRIVVAQGKSDSQSFRTIGHLGGEDLDLGPNVRAVQDGDDHVVDGGHGSMSEGTHRVADGDAVGCKVVVPLSEDKSLLSFNSAPDSNHVGGSRV